MSSSTNKKSHTSANGDFTHSSDCSDLDTVTVHSALLSNSATEFTSSTFVSKTTEAGNGSELSDGSSFGAAMTRQNFLWANPRTSSLSLIINSHGASDNPSTGAEGSDTQVSLSATSSHNEASLYSKHRSEIPTPQTAFQTNYTRLPSSSNPYQQLSDLACKQDIQVDEDLSFIVEGRIVTPMSLAIYYFLCIITGGAYLLLCRWYIQLEVKTRTRSCILQQASHVYLINHWGEQSLEPVRKATFAGKLSSAFPQHFDPSLPVSQIPQDILLSYLMYFEYRYFKFILDPVSGKFLPNYIWRDPKWQSVNYITSNRDSNLEISRKVTLFGSNTINIKEKSTFRLLVDEVLHPFFVFQIASIILWCLDSYYQYAICILIITTTSALATLIDTKGMLRRIRELSRFSCQVRYWRDGAWSYGRSEELVPGDLFELESGQIPIVPCDAILLVGDCIVNESMLTGESLPVSKSPATDQDICAINFEEEEPSSSSRMSRFFLFSGTEMIRVRPGITRSDRTVDGDSIHSPSLANLVDQPTTIQDPLATRRGAVAVVVRTGFNTTKGSLVRSILFPRPNKFKFYQDSFRFIGVLAIISGLGFTSSLYFFIQLGMPWTTIMLRALDLITIVVPPALPATLAIGTSFAMSRLRQTNIFCTSPPRVNICGKINVMCFDKTGTLTQEGLDVLGIRFTSPCLHKGETPFEDVPQPNAPTRFSGLHRNMDALVPAFATNQRIDFSNKPAKGSMNMPSPSPRTSYSSGGPLNVSYSANQSGVSLFSPRELAMGGVTTIESEHTYPLIVCAMATCHSIKVVKGALVGDPLDLRMFDFTGWHLEEDANTQPSGFFRRRLSRTHSIGSGQSHHAAAMMVVRPSWVPDFDTVVNGSRYGGRVGSEEVFTELGVVREFEFISRLRRMSVIVRQMRYWSSMYSPGLADSATTPSSVASKDMKVFVKGAPEVMRSICISSSLPPDFDEQLRNYTHHGYRVIACAWRKLESMTWSNMMKLKRSAVECDLHFLGFIVFENKLKAGTTPVIQTLHKAKIRQVMCTGDSLLTSISVSRECGLIDPEKTVYVPRFVEGEAHEEFARIIWEDVDKSGSVLDGEFLKPVLPTGHPLARRSSSSLARSTSRLQQSWAESLEIQLNNYELAITGDVFQWMLDFSNDETFERMLVKCQVFSRMSPDQKHFLVENLQHLGYCVGFCGDGTNDCGALKAADTGLSLSEAEASVAAPFTSKSSDLECVLRVIREGRAALVTSFSCFKYMALYSLIQFTTVSLLYSIGQNIEDFQFMYIDLMLIIPIAVFMGRTGPYSSIASKRPTASLVSKKVLTSLIGQVIIQATFQFFVFFWVRSQPWYYKGKADMENQTYSSFENTSVFLVSCFQYIIVAVVFTVGPPYQETIWKNVPYVTTLALLSILTTIVTICPTNWMIEQLGILVMPIQARWFILLLGALNLAVSLALEHGISPLISQMVGRFIDHISYSSDCSNGVGHGSRMTDQLLRVKVRKWKDRGKIFKVILEDFKVHSAIS
ncbi:hypothetical protein BDV3_005595 [Batrachochytrium dendrobatidis]